MEEMVLVTVRAEGWAVKVAIFVNIEEKYIKNIMIVFNDMLHGGFAYGLGVICSN